jgi:hypothetical protein
MYDKYKSDAINNNIIVDDEVHTSENLIKAVFEIFVESGPYSGTLREYSGSSDNLIDIKSGLYKKEILSKKYSIEEYQKLLKNIEKHNIKYYKKYDTFNYSKNELNTLKKNSENKLDKAIQSLVKNVSHILNKDKDFIIKYTDLLRKMGNFKENIDINKDDNKSKIKHNEYVNKNKLDYI